MYIHFNPNPHGKYVGDCVVRAICKLTNKDWDTVYAGISVKGLELKDLPNANYVWEAYLRDQGYVKTLLPDTCPWCYTVKQFCIDFPKGKYLVATGTHVVAIQNGDYYDAWDSGNETLTEYWRQKS